MKIITCAPLPPPHGGITNWYKVLCNEAERRQYEFLNVNVSPKKSVDGRSLFYRIFVQGFRMFGQYHKLRKLAKQNPDVCAVHIATSGQLALVRDILFLSFLRRKNIRSVYHLHFGEVPNIWAKKGIQYRYLCRAVSLASKVIAIDPKTYATLLPKLGEDKIYYIPNPVDFAEKETEAGENNVLFLGNVLASKGVEELLKAWEDINGDYPQWKLTVAGFCEEDYKAYLESAFSLERVEMCGSVAHKGAMDLLSKSAFLVLPSYTEGLPNVVLEAMMRRKAVIATDVGAVADVLSGGCGMVIPPKDIEAIKSAMKKLMENPELCEEMGSNGRNKATAQYVTSVVVDQYVELWKGNSITKGNE